MFRQALTAVEKTHKGIALLIDRDDIGPDTRDLLTDAHAKITKALCQLKSTVVDCDTNQNDLPALMEREHGQQ